MTNTKETSDETGSVQVTKTFTGIEVSEIPADFQITASWTEDGAEKTAEFTTTDKQPDADSENLTYTWTISDLPIGTEVTFTETDYELDGYTVQTMPPANTEDGKVTTKATATAAEPGTASFENAYTKDAHIDIVIKKVNDKGASIDGAVFELYRLNNESIHEKMTQSTYSWLDSNNRFTVQTSGFTLEGLEDGTYQIVEVTPPAGYVITVSDPVTFTVTNGEVVSGSNVLKNRAAYTAATETEKDTYTIVNTPGVSLPNTGGSGTLAYTLGGGLLSLTAGLFLALRLRRREETA